MTKDQSVKFDQAQVAFKGKIRTFARNCVRQLPGYDLEDIEQELLVVLWKCVLKYDPNKGASFNTLFQGCARNQVIQMVRRASTASRTAIVVNLEAEDLRRAVDAVFYQGSAEDSAMALFEIRERLSA